MKQQRQEVFWIAADALPETPRHVFYEKLNRLLDEADFDRFFETLCEPYYAESGEASGTCFLPTWTYHVSLNLRDHGRGVCIVEPPR